MLGSGRTELFRALIGLDKINSGKIKLNLNNLFFEIKPKDLYKFVGYVTEDRRNEGLWLNMSIIKNISISFSQKYVFSLENMSIWEGLEPPQKLASEGLLARPLEASWDPPWGLLR